MKKRERGREGTFEGTEGRISYSDPQLYQKNVLHIVLPCLSFSPTLSVVLSTSLSFPLSWSFYSLKRYREREGGWG